MTILLIGLASLSLAIWGLVEDVRVIAQPFYAWAWWSTILVLDGFTATRRGSSLLTSRRALLLPILVWSVTFWFLFELLNLRLTNWYYVGVYARGSQVDLVRASLFGVVSFATVFLGIFEMFDAIGRRGREADRRPRELSAWPTWLLYSIQAAGILMAGIALLFPRYLAPLVWGSVTFLLEPWNFRLGARSLLSDVRGGNFRTPVRHLAAGLLCGLVWESFNFFSPQKWIYTVRGLEEPKLFEMPLLGFLGFPALALDAFSFFAFVSYWLHGNRTWENPEDVSQRIAARVGLSPSGFAATIPLHAALWLAVSLSIPRVNVGSVALELQDLKSLSIETAAALEERGITRPRQLLRAIENPDRLDGLAMAPSELKNVKAELRLLTLKGIGRHHGELLRKAGIVSVSDLAHADPGELYRALERARKDDDFPALREEMVRVWVDAARRSEPR
jgi:hypothetical protein